MPIDAEVDIEVLVLVRLNPGITFGFRGNAVDKVLAAQRLNRRGLIVWRAPTGMSDPKQCGWYVVK